MKSTEYLAIAVIGGQSNASIVGSVERLNPQTGIWEAVAPLRTARSRHAAVEFRGKIYVVGG